MPHAPLHLSDQAKRTTEQPISYFMKAALENPNLISLAAGLVDEPSLPVKEMAQCFGQLFGNESTGRAALQYGTTQGLLPLRRQLLERFATAEGLSPHSLALTPDDVIITNGSQQLLYILSEVLLDPGDIVLTEAPSYFVYHSVLTCRGAEVIGIPMDDQGLRTDLLETLLLRLEQAGKLERIKLIYTVDYFQNPSGLSLAGDRRSHILELARRFSKRHRIPVLEDAAYRELRLDGPDLRSIKCLDTTNEYVIYTSTFSKPFAPGIRVGYGFLPKDLMTPVIRTKGNHDFGSGNLGQNLASQALSNGCYDEHLRDLQAAYRYKRDVMNEALLTAFREWPSVSWHVPQGGLYVWLRFPTEVATGPKSHLMEECLREGVIYVPGEFCHVIDSAGRLSANEIRLCFGVATVEQIREGIRRLAKAAKRLSVMQEPARERTAVVA